jgi:hypothetical protein
MKKQTNLQKQQNHPKYNHALNAAASELCAIMNAPK